MCLIWTGLFPFSLSNYQNYQIIKIIFPKSKSIFCWSFCPFFWRIYFSPFFWMVFFSFFPLFLMGLFSFFFWWVFPVRWSLNLWKISPASQLPFIGFHKKLSGQQITLAGLSYIFIMLARTKHYWPNVSSLIQCKSGRKIHIFILRAGDATFLAKNVLFD